MIIDSQRTVARSWLRVIPTARSRPSSRLRSMIDSASVLAMPKSAMTMAKNEQHVDQVEDLVDLAGLRGLELARVSSFGPGYA